MKALLVEEERTELLRLKAMLEQEDGIQVVGMSEKGARLEERLKELAPDIVFLDLDAQANGGLELAARIRAADPVVDIVFTACSDRHALEAYTVYPLDYMRKPVDHIRLARTIGMARRRSEHGAQAMLDGAADSRLVCLGSLTIRRPNSETAYPRWRTTKAQELFAYLLHHRGHMVSRESLFRLLWPEFDAERAAAQLYNTIYTIRAVLKSEGLHIAIAKGGPAAGYRLDLGTVRLDVDLWEQSLLALPSLGRDTASRYETVLNAYTGDYLQESDYSWALEERLRLRELWLDNACRLAGFYHSHGMDEEANSMLQRLHLTHVLPSLMPIEHASAAERS